MKHQIYDLVKCDYNNGDGFWCVDAWRPNEEEGVVAAVINDVTGDVFAIDSLDDLAKEVIREKVEEIKKDLPSMLAEIYLEMTDAEKDEFLRQTGNS